MLKRPAPRATLRDVQNLRREDRQERRPRDEEDGEARRPGAKKASRTQVRTFEFFKETNGAVHFKELLADGEPFESLHDEGLLMGPCYIRKTWKPGDRIRVTIELDAD
jgi:hypothetical protein